MKTIVKSLLAAIICTSIPAMASAQSDTVPTNTAPAVVPTIPTAQPVDSISTAPVPTAQSATEVPTDSTLLQGIATEIPATYTGEQNVYGDTKYYNYEDDPDYYRQPKNPYRTFGHNFNKFFFEGVALVSAYGETAIGGHFAYIPQQWGGYMAVMNSIDYYPSEYLFTPSDWYSIGAVFRCSEPRSSSDFQIFGGVVFHEGAGFEVGFRYAFENFFGNRGFSWWSLSYSMGHVNHTPFFTIGLSIPAALLLF